MRRGLLMAMVVAAAVQITAQAQVRPNFSGAWTRVVDKNATSPQGGGRSRHNINQTASEITVTIVGRDGPETQTYRLDGTETTNRTQSPEGPLTVTGKATWEGQGLVIETRREIRGMTITTRETRTLDVTGNQMTIEATTRSPQGETRVTLAFVRG
jgi:hypothetical protein